MKKLLTAAAIALVTMAACNESSTKESVTTENTTTPAATTESTNAEKRAKEIKDSTDMLDKKLADPNSKYSPDSLK